MKVTLIRLFFTCTLALSTLQVKAQIVTDRPDQTESSSTVGKGVLQLESGVLVGFAGDDENALRQILAPSTLFRYGISEGIEIRLLSQLESLKIQDQVYQGISDLEIGAKFQLFKKPGSKFEVAFISHLFVPTGSDNLSLDAFGTINKLAVSQELNEQLGMGYNLGYNYYGNGIDMLTYSAVLGVGVNDRVAIYVEPYGELLDMEEFVLNFDTGLTYLLKDNLQLDFSIGAGLTHKMNYISAGVCWKIAPGS